MATRVWWAALAIGCALLPALGQAEVRTWTAGIMGTDVRILVWNPSAADAQAVTRALDEFRRIDALMSGWRDSGEVARINHFAHKRPVTVSPETFALLERSVAISKASGGAFDITWAALRGVWDFKASRPALPPADRRAAAAALVDYRKLTLGPERQVRFGRPGMAIGLGGIAKGYAVDRAVKLLEAAGLKHFVVSAGGDVCLRGTRGDSPWRVGIKHPRQAGLLATLDARDECVLTSGDYERFIQVGGKRYHHILNPDTGMPARDALSVTVVTQSATDADGYSTAAFVLGGQKGLDFLAARPNTAGLIVDGRGELLMTPGLADRLTLHAKHVTP